MFVELHEVKEDIKKSRRGGACYRPVWRCAMILAVCVVAAGAGGLWVQGRAIDYLVRVGLDRVLPGAGFSVRSMRVDGGLGRALRIHDLVLVGGPGTPSGSQTLVRVELIEVALPRVRDWLFDRRKWVARLSLRGVEALLDARSEWMAPLRPGPVLTPEELARMSRLAVRLMPAVVDWDVRSFEVLADAQRYKLTGAGLRLREGRTGRLFWDGGVIEAGGVAVRLDADAARAYWNQGVVYLSGVTLGRGVELANLVVDLARPGGVGLRGDFKAFGGWVGMSLGYGEEEGYMDADLSVTALGLDLESVDGWASGGWGLTGRVERLDIKWVAVVDDLVGGQARIGLFGTGVGFRGGVWDRVEVEARLNDEVVRISRLEAKRGASGILLEGDCVLPGDGDWGKAVWSGRLDADLRDVGILAELGVPQAEGVGGSVRAKVEASGGEEGISAELEATGTGLTWRGLRPVGMNLSARFWDGELEVREFLLGDWVKASGTWRPEGGRYCGRVALSLDEVAGFVEALKGGGQSPFGGGGELDWSGEGGEGEHRGKVSARLVGVSAGAGWQGMGGRFAGSYGPEHLKVGEARLEQGGMELDFSLEADADGVRMGGIRLASGGEELLSGAVDIPWNPFVLLKGKSWAEGFLAGRELAGAVTGREMPLEKLAALAGQVLPVTGWSRVEARLGGGIESPRVEASWVLRDLRTAAPDAVELASEVRVDFLAKDGVAAVSGLARVPRIEPVTLEASFPFGFRVAEGRLDWVDPTGVLRGRVRVPETDLAVFREFVPGVRRVAGRVGAEIVLGNSLLAPSIDGVARVTGGLLEVHRGVPVVEDVNGVCRFDGKTFRFVDTAATVGAGRLRLSGGGDFSDVKNVRFDLRLVGSEVLVHRDRNFRLRTNLDLSLRGGLESATIAGAVRLVDGRVYQRLEITPLLQSAQSGVAPLLLPELRGLVPAPFADWKLDVSVANESPFLIVGNLASGEIIPDIAVGGTLGQPVLKGGVDIKNVQAYLPFSTVSIPEGRIILDPASPRVPLVDVRGFSEVLNYEVQLIAQGPLDKGNLFLRSDPPLPQESIVLLLTTGLVPGAHTGASLGEAAIGQGSLLLLKTFARQFEREGVDTDSLINRVQITTRPAVLQGLMPTTRGEFRLNKNFGVMAQRDGYGFLGTGLTYTVRFK